MTQLTQFLLAAAGLSFAAGTACADVRYDFTATSSVPFDGISYTGSFSVVVPDFIATETMIPVASMTQCAVMSSSGPAPCSDANFQFNLSPGYETVGFGVYLNENAPRLEIEYYFVNGAFSTPGVHASDLLGPSQAGTLTVTVVPEAASGAYAALGLAGLLAAVRRSRSKRSA